MQHDWPTLLPRLRSFVYARISDLDAADDVVSETLERALRGRWRDQGHPFSAWVFRIARSAIIDHYRRQARRGDVPLFDCHAVPGPTTAGVEACEALAALLPRERAAHCLAWAGYSNAEIGARWGVSEGAVKSLRHRARDRA